MRWPFQRQSNADRPREAASQRQINPQQLRDILASHSQWLSSGGLAGQKADLRGADLSNRDMANVDLRQANLTSANLSSTDLSSAKLSGANMQGANLEHAKLLSADLHNADLRHTDLTDAELGSAVGLMCRQLAGSNITGAQLPQDINYDTSISCVNDVIRDAGKTLVTLLTLCAFSWLTLSAIKDAMLIVGAANIPYPVLGTTLPVIWFVWLMPVALLLLFINLHLYLQRLWESLARLPAVFRDGQEIYRRLYPWLPVGIMQPYFPRLNENRPSLSMLQVSSSFAVLWVVVPLTLYYFWARSLCSHNTPLLHVQIFAFSGSIVAAIYFFRTARLTLRDEKNRQMFWRDHHTYAGAGLFGVVGLLFLALSYYAIHGVPATVGDGQFPGRSLPCYLAPHICEWVGSHSGAVMSDEEISMRPNTSDGNNLSGIKGVDLRHRDLRGIDLTHAFLVNSDMRETDLTGAKLWYADLRGVKLDSAIMNGAMLDFAQLAGASLGNAWLNNGASLTSANFTGAQMQAAHAQTADFSSAILRDTDLEQSDMSRANLANADLLGANLKDVILNGADLSGARNVTPKQLNAASVDQTTILPSYLHCEKKKGKLVVNWNKKPIK